MILKNKLYVLVVLALVCQTLLIIPVSSQKETKPTPTPKEADMAIGSVAGAPTPAQSRIDFIDLESRKCDTKVVDNILNLYGGNQDIFKTCVEKSTYPLFPYPGYLPTDEQITKICKSDYCVTFMKDFLRLDMPECNLGGAPIRSALETMMKTCADVSEGLVSLTDDQLFILIKWRYNRNIAKEQGLPYDTDSPAAINYETQLEKSMKKADTITLSANHKSPAEGSGSGDADNSNGLRTGTKASDNSTLNATATSAATTAQRSSGITTLTVAVAFVASALVTSSILF